MMRRQRRPHARAGFNARRLRPPTHPQRDRQSNPKSRDRPKLPPRAHPPPSRTPHTPGRTYRSPPALTPPNFENPRIIPAYPVLRSPHFSRVSPRATNAADRRTPQPPPPSNPPTAWPGVPANKQRFHVGKLLGHTPKPIRHRRMKCRPNMPHRETMIAMPVRGHRNPSIHPSRWHSSALHIHAQITGVLAMPQINQLELSKNSACNFV